jgi:pyridoxal phosphate enzyme (YggS family)
MDYSYVKKQLESVKAKINAAADKAGKKQKDIKLVAVSKTFPPDAVFAAYESGHRLFGENRVQELIDKSEKLPDDIKWHLIGHLQSNKAGKAVKISSCIHSIDSEDLVSKVAKLAGEHKKVQKVLLEINISGESTKFGLRDEAEIMRCASAVVASDHLKLEGLMTMAPFGAEDWQLHKLFAALRELRGKLEKSFKIKMPELSMGMSSDYEIAIDEGATIIRIGTAIFGKRG